MACPQTTAQLHPCLASPHLKTISVLAPSDLEQIVRTADVAPQPRVSVLQIKVFLWEISNNANTLLGCKVNNVIPHCTVFGLFQSTTSLYRQEPFAISEMAVSRRSYC